MIVRTAVLLASLAQGTSVQEITVASQVSCGACTIKAVPLGRLRFPGSDSAAFAAWPSSGIQDGRGYFVTVSHEEDRPPRVFASTGVFERLLGSTGSGPGEYRRPRVVKEWGPDSLVILDDELGRASIHLRSGKFVRSFPAPSRSTDALRTATGTFVVNAPVHDASRIGKPLQLFREDGTYIGAAGESAIPIRPRQLNDVYRLLARAPSGFWSVSRVFRYRAEQFSDRGVLLKRLILTTPWFRDYDEIAYTTPTTAPMPEVWAAWTRAGAPHVLWVVARVADRNWARGLGKPVGRREDLPNEPMYPKEDLGKVYDGIVEVIDTRSGVRIASQRFDQSFELGFGGGVVGSARKTEDGEPYIELYALTLVGDSAMRSGQ